MALASATATATATASSAFSFLPCSSSPARRSYASVRFSPLIQIVGMISSSFKTILPRCQSPLHRKMGSSSKGLVMLSSNGASSFSHSFANVNRNSCFSFSNVSSVGIPNNSFKFPRFSSTTTCSSIQPPDLTRLGKTAQISLTPDQVDEFAPKIQQVIEWFGQLQSVDLQSVQPSLRAESENNLGENAPETFDNRDAMIASVPSYEEPYIKVPRVLSMD